MVEHITFFFSFGLDQIIKEEEFLKECFSSYPVLISSLGISTDSESAGALGVFPMFSSHVFAVTSLSIVILSIKVSVNFSTSLHLFYHHHPFILYLIKYFSCFLF